jgi:hypothetical protein
MKSQTIVWSGAAGLFAFVMALAVLGEHWRNPERQEPSDRIVDVSPRPTALDYRFSQAHDESPENDPGLFISTERGAAVRTADYRLSRPYSFQNLTIYFIRGSETLPSTPLVTLEEAIERRLVVVNANGPALENRSQTDEVFAQAGEIIKGGSQDRALQYDELVPPAREYPLAVWCVEQNRSSPRGSEPGGYFNSSRFVLGTADLKRAAFALYVDGSGQAGVWRAVTRTQERLKQKCGALAKSDVSPSSLQLTLESSVVRDAVAPYCAAFGSALAEQEDAIGCVVAVDGRVVSADVYASGELFRKLWPKLLDGAAVEALIGVESEASPEPLGEDAVRAFLAEPERTPPSGAISRKRLHIQERRSERVLLLESWDRSRENLVLHRSFVAR